MSAHRRKKGPGGHEPWNPCAPPPGLLVLATPAIFGLETFVKALLFQVLCLVLSPTKGPLLGAESNKSKWDAVFILRELTI